MLTMLVKHWINDFVHRLFRPFRLFVSWNDKYRVYRDNRDERRVHSLPDPQAYVTHLGPPLPIKWSWSSSSNTFLPRFFLLDNISIFSILHPLISSCSYLAFISGTYRRSEWQLSRSTSSWLRMRVSRVVQRSDYSSLPSGGNKIWLFI